MQRFSKPNANASQFYLEEKKIQSFTRFSLFSAFLSKCLNIFSDPTHNLTQLKNVEKVQLQKLYYNRDP
jgi:hypothetical protein